MRKDERPDPSRVELDARGARSVSQLCSWCGRLKRGDEWVVLEAEATRPAVSHGVCPECLERVLRQERERG
jgi:hypothetical protein